MTVRSADIRDVERIGQLLEQVLAIHHEGRPDLFRSSGRKFSDDELKSLLHNEEIPIFVAVDENDRVLGYAICIVQSLVGRSATLDRKTLHVDDLCVDEQCRHQHVGKTLYEHVCRYAKEQGCFNVTLNVWAFNHDAIRFYEACGMTPQKHCMETVL